MRNIDELKSLLVIDRLELDQVLINQAQLFFEVSENLAWKTSQRDRLKESVAEKYAQLDRSIRATAFASGVKITENAVQSQIITDSEYLGVVESHLDARESVDLIQALRESFLQRSYMLKELTSLLISGYWMGDSVKSARDSDFGKDAYDVDRKRLAKARKD